MCSAARFAETLSLGGPLSMCFTVGKQRASIPLVLGVSTGHGRAQEPTPGTTALFGVTTLPRNHSLVKVRVAGGGGGFTKKRLRLTGVVSDCSPIRSVRAERVGEPLRPPSLGGLHRRTAFAHYVRRLWGAVWALGLSVNRGLFGMRIEHCPSRPWNNMSIGRCVDGSS